MKFKNSFWLTVIVTLQPGVSVLAHPGHGHKHVDGNSVVHYLIEPVHIISLAMLVALFFVARSLFTKPRRRTDARE